MSLHHVDGTLELVATTGFFEACPPQDSLRLFMSTVGTKDSRRLQGIERVGIERTLPDALVDPQRQSRQAERQRDAQENTIHRGQWRSADQPEQRGEKPTGKRQAEYPSPRSWCARKSQMHSRSHEGNPAAHVAFPGVC